MLNWWFITSTSIWIWILPVAIVVMKMQRGYTLTNFVWISRKMKMGKHFSRPKFAKGYQINTGKSLIVLGDTWIVFPQLAYLINSFHQNVYTRCYFSVSTLLFLVYHVSFWSLPWASIPATILSGIITHGLCGILYWICC